MTTARTERDINTMQPNCKSCSKKMTNEEKTEMHQNIKKTKAVCQKSVNWVSSVSAEKNMQGGDK